MFTKKLFHFRWQVTMSLLFPIGLTVVVALAGCSTNEQAPAPKGAHDGHAAQNEPSPTPKNAPDGHAAHEHADHDAIARADGATTLMVQARPAEPRAGQSVALHLMVHDAAGKMIRRFDTLHEKKAHLIIVREGLDQFAHVHPEVDDEGNFTAEFQFPTGGKYYLFLDQQPAGGKQAVVRAEVRATGDAPVAPALVPNVPGKVTTNDLVATISVKNAAKGTPATIQFKITDATGKPVTDLEPYLGAMGHLVVISADGREYAHAHPDTTKAPPGEVSFMAHFAKSGLYKGWGQFQRAGNIRTVPFVIEVK